MKCDRKWWNDGRMQAGLFVKPTGSQFCVPRDPRPYAAYDGRGKPRPKGAWNAIACTDCGMGLVRRHFGGEVCCDTCGSTKGVPDGDQDL